MTHVNKLYSQPENVDGGFFSVNYVLDISEVMTSNDSDDTVYFIST